MDRGYFWTGGVICGPYYLKKNYLPMIDKMLPNVIAWINAT